MGGYLPKLTMEISEAGLLNSNGKPAEKNEAVAGFPHTLPSKFLQPPPLDLALS